MTLLLSFGLVIIGLLLLTFGGNNLVDGAVGLARRLHLSEAIIGLTIVAIGTSMPELIVSFLAAINGSTDIAVGNVLGSNIANVFFILGMIAVFSKVDIRLTRSTRFFDIPVVLIITIILGVFVSDRWLNNFSQNMIHRSEGFILLFFAILFILYSIKHQNFVPDESQAPIQITSTYRIGAALTGGIIALFIGGKLLIDGAVDLARAFHVSEAVIGLTIVAIGTSMPELVTSIIAARRGSADLAVGNILGSNIMNILVILGLTACILPIPFPDRSFYDLGISLIGPLLVSYFAFIWRPNLLGKKEGIILLVCYGAYLFSLFLF